MPFSAVLKYFSDKKKHYHYVRNIDSSPDNSELDPDWGNRGGGGGGGNYSEILAIKFRDCTSV